VAGAAFTTMQLSASQPTVHCSLRFPDLREDDDSAQDLPAPGNARNLPFPPVTDPEDLPRR
jgi:hypothetical protein